MTAFFYEPCTTSIHCALCSITLTETVPRDHLPSDKPSNVAAAGRLTSRSHEAVRSICLAQALECQKISDELLGVLREFNCAWQERILRPVQCVRGIVEASPWIVNAIALSRDVGEPCCAASVAAQAANQTDQRRCCDP